MDQASSNSLAADTPAGVADQGAFGRLARENLVSFVVVASHSVDRDVRQVEAVFGFADKTFQYFEIVVVASMPSPEWREKMRDLGLTVRNIRIVMVDATMGYEELSTAALRFVIGDLIVSLHPDEIGIPDIERLMQLCASGKWDMIKTFHAHRPKSPVERVGANLVRWGMRLATGRNIQTFQARAFAMNRTALTRLQAVGGAMRYFRIFDLSGLVAEGRFEFDAPPRRHLLGGFGEKLRIASMLISSSAGRLVLWLALVCAVLSLGSVVFAAGAFGIWLVLDEVAPGWTSLSIVLSLLFSANFGVMAAICLGLLQIIRQSTPDPVELFATELSGGDLFQRGDRLNVEGSEKEGAMKRGEQG